MTYIAKPPLHHPSLEKNTLGFTRREISSVLLGELEYEARAATISTFGGGTNELQRELIAQFGLGMPKPVR